MKPEKARKQLERMLASFSPGSVLMMIGEVFSERAEVAREGGSEIMFDNSKDAEVTLSLVGLGLDVILPKPRAR